MTATAARPSSASAPARRSRAPPPPDAPGGTMLSGPILLILWPPAPHRQRRPRPSRTPSRARSSRLARQLGLDACDVLLVRERLGREADDQVAAVVGVEAPDLDLM